MGYHRAGFDQIVGIDIQPQKNYPFTFIQGDALHPPLDLGAFDLIHASPPCQAYSATRISHPGKEYPRFIEPTRALLQASGRPYIIENVERAPLLDPVVLCGTEFGLSVFDPDKGRVMHLKRHRLFEMSWFAMSTRECSCKIYRGSIAGVYGGGREDRTQGVRQGKRGGYTPTVALRRSLMDIDWMTMAELSEAIPPAYTEYLARQFLDSPLAQRQ